MSSLIGFLKSLFANHKTEMGMIAAGVLMFVGRQGWLDDGTRDLLLSAVALWTGVAVTRTKAKNAVAIDNAAQGISGKET
jgi:hypothetical protein